MTQQNSQVAQSSQRQLTKPELEQGQQVRILQGQYRGTVGQVSRREWHDDSGEWVYEVSEGRVFLGQYRSKDLW